MIYPNKIIDKYSNYNVYFLGSGSMGHSIEEERLLKVIEACRDLLKKPYIRFIYASRFDEAAGVVYDGSERVTKLVSLSDIEKMIEERKFHK